jgi:hypothetical protein
VNTTLGIKHSPEGTEAGRYNTFERIRQEVMAVGRQLTPFEHRPAAAALLSRPHH